MSRRQPAAQELRLVAERRSPVEASEGTYLRAALIGSDGQPASAETIRFRKAVASRWLSASTPSQ